MDPLYLRALMHGEVPFKKADSVKLPKSEVEVKLDKEIEVCADAMELDEDPNLMRLLTPQMKKAKRELEIKETLAFPDLYKQIDLAVTLIISEGVHHLNEEENQKLFENLEKALANSSQINTKNAAEFNLQEIMEIENESLLSLAKIANAIYLEERYMDCYAIYSLMTILKPEFSEFWFRCGIAAQSSKNYVLAGQAYAAASELDPSHIAARLLGAECHFRNNDFAQAKAELEASILISETSQVESEWLELQASLKEIISSAKK